MHVNTAALAQSKNEETFVQRPQSVYPVGGNVLLAPISAGALFTKPFPVQG